jgi:hypothetical protein
VSSPNIWSRNRQQSCIGARRQTPAQKMAKSAQDVQDGRRTPARAGVCWPLPAQKIAKSAIGFLAGPNWGGQIPCPLFETIVDQNLGGCGPLSPLKILFLVSSRATSAAAWWRRGGSVSGGGAQRDGGNTVAATRRLRWWRQLDRAMLVSKTLRKIDILTNHRRYVLST